MNRNRVQLKRNQPSYLELHRKGELRKRAEALYDKLQNCDICPHQCSVNRLKDEEGICGVGRKALVSSYGPHFGEEPPLVGINGSGTIFFAGCNLKCVFCQNYDISHFGMGEITEEEKIADMMIHLQNIGCQNINFVTPTHVVAQIVGALEKAVPKGLSIPLVYNTGGYDSLSTLELLEDIFDIYMPDFKYGDVKIGERLSSAPNYTGMAKLAIKEMHRQVGDLICDSNGIARRGLVIRHLVLPGDLAGTEKVMTFIAEEISKKSYVNLMDQYRPMYKADKFPEIARRILPNEFRKAEKITTQHGIKVNW
jgi:putative pyruvate formate lyase activating enzyme